MDHVRRAKKPLQSAVETANDDLRVILTENRDDRLALCVLTDVTIDQRSAIVVSIEANQSVEAVVFVEAPYFRSAFSGPSDLS
jgi:hypothetical protein